MVTFFKTFGLGVLYTITLPLILLVWAGYAVYCFFVFIYMSIRNVIIFFSGGTPNGDMKEDVEAKRILLARREKEETISNILISPNSQAIYQAPTVNPIPQYQPENFEEENNIEEFSDETEESQIEEENNDDFVN